MRPACRVLRGAVARQRGLAASGTCCISSPLLLATGLRRREEGRARTGDELQGQGCRCRAETGYAMTGCRLPLGSFRNLNVWLGLLEKSPYKLYIPWKRFLYSASHQPVASLTSKRLCLSPTKYHILLIPLSTCLPRISVRLKSDKSSRKNVKQTVQEEAEEEDEDEERSDSEDEFEDDSTVVKDYKDLEKVVQSFRFDVIMKAGLDIARKFHIHRKGFLTITTTGGFTPFMEMKALRKLRGVKHRLGNKVEDAFYNGELRLNGEKLWKKSRAVKVGDTLDLIIGEDKETETAVVMRVVLKKASEKTDNDKYKVILRRWRNLKVPKQDVFK